VQEDTLNLQNQVLALRKVLLTLQANYKSDVGNYKTLLEDQHKLELSREQLRQTIEREREKARHIAAATMQSIVRGHNGRKKVSGGGAEGGGVVENENFEQLRN